jgi:hypothetical protein
MRKAMLAAAIVPIAFAAAAQAPMRPDVNAAHRGGGVILEGAPGDPAPAVMQTPPLDRNAPAGTGLVVQVPQIVTAPPPATTPPPAPWTQR